MIERESVRLRRLAGGARRGIVGFCRFLASPRVTVDKLVEGWGRQTSLASTVDVHHYTGLKLCAGARVEDLTSKEERDSVLGFALHVHLTMAQQRKPFFEYQSPKTGRRKVRSSTWKVFLLRGECFNLRR